MRSGIVCSGVSCLDLFLYGTAPLPTRESLSMVRETQYRAGGATSNTGRALAKLGMPTAYMTLIGDDANGEIMLGEWRKDGIDTRYVVRTTEAGTSLSTLPVYEDGKRGVYFCPGTNDIMDVDNIFGPERAYLDVLRGMQAFHIGYPPLMQRLQGAALAALLQAVRDTGVLVSLDTTPVADDTTLFRMLGPGLRVAHMFTPNVMEAAQTAGQFTGLAARAAAETQASGVPAEIEDIITPAELDGIADFLLAQGLAIVVITLGSNGVYLATADAARLSTVPLASPAWAGQRVYVPAYRVDGPVNTTGAGDTFTAGILTGMCQGVASLREVAELAHAASALHVDLSRGARSFAEVQQARPTLPVRTPRNPHLAALVGV
jgi:sugar/nucleoside kinase (ribokinase family)